MCIIMATRNSASELIETSTSSASIDDTSSSSSRSLAVKLLVKLTAEDIPGAELKEPLERHGIPALQ